ncbi:MAG: hypothetical protein NHF94_01315 [Candidatus Bostrichicola ureolyticus]|nr:MAG: hypothetical protein NHF94_01315 [Candidatus Bostrichicola ureolyticus]
MVLKHQFNDIKGQFKIYKGINNCLIINDNYNFNIQSIKIAVDFIQKKL